MELINEKALSSLVKMICDREIEKALRKYRLAFAEQQMFNRKDAAHYLGIGPSKLDKEVTKGAIKPVFPFEGLTKYYTKQELDEVIADAKAYKKKTEIIRKKVTSIEQVRQNLN